MSVLDSPANHGPDSKSAEATAIDLRVGQSTVRSPGATRAVLKVLRRSANGLRVSVVEPKSALLIAAKRLHAQMYLKRGYIQKTDLVAHGSRIGLKADPYQNRSQYFIVERDHGSVTEIVATARMIYADNASGMNSFQMYEKVDIEPRYRSEIDQLDPSKCFEFSALVKKDGEDPIATMLLYQAVWRYSLAQGFTTWFMTCDPRLLDWLLTMFGAGMTPVGPTTFYDGGDVTPAMLDVAKLYTWMCAKPALDHPMEYELHKTVTLLLMGDEFYANLPDVVDVREAILPTSPAEG